MDVTRKVMTNEEPGKKPGAETALANFFASGVLALGDKLGPLLWQLPENLPYDAERLADFFALLPRTTTQAAELATRHDDKVPDDRALTSTDAERPLRELSEKTRLGLVVSLGLSHPSG